MPTIVYGRDICFTNKLKQTLYYIVDHDRTKVNSTALYADYLWHETLNATYYPYTGAAKKKIVTAALQKGWGDRLPLTKAERAKYAEVMKTAGLEALEVNKSACHNWAYNFVKEYK